MTFFYKEKVINTITNLSDFDPFIFQSGDVAVLKSTNAKVIVGTDSYDNNITLKYPGQTGAGGIYTNNPETPLLEFTPGGGIAFDNLKLTGKELISDDPTISISDNAAQLHIASTGNVIQYWEADTDGVGGEIPFLYFSKGAGAEVYRIDSSGATDNFEFISANATGGQGFEFTLATSTPPPKGQLPVITGPVIKPLIMDAMEITTGVNLNMNSKDITNVPNIGNGASTVGFNSNIEMNNKNMLNVGDIYVKGLIKNVGQPNIQVGDDLELLSGVNLLMEDSYVRLKDTGGGYDPLSPPVVGVGEGALWQYSSDVFYNNNTDVFNLSSPFYNRGSVGQITSKTTPVTLNTSSGAITTVSLTDGPGASFNFVVNDNTITINSIILLEVISYSGAYSTNGLPLVSVSGIFNGSFSVLVMNAHHTNSLNGTLTFNFVSY